MKSLVKGLKVTVNVGIKADSIATENFRHSESGERRNEEAYKGLDVSVSAGIELDESDGDVDLREISDLLHQSLTESVKEQVKECLDERCSKPETCNTSKEDMQRSRSDFERSKNFNSMMCNE